jgi:hypothetical protein
VLDEGLFSPSTLWVPRTHPPSSGNYPVLMDDASHSVGPSQPGKVDVADERVRTGSRRRTVAERSVGTVRVVVLDVLGEHGLQMAAAEDGHPVKALAPQCADDTLRNRIGPTALGQGT